MERTAVIIVAGGHGTRYGSSRPKQFLLLGGQPVLSRTINTFAKALPGAEIVVVLPADQIDFWHNLAARFEVSPHNVAEGGDSRFASVRNGLSALKQEVDLIAVQDGVRPLCSPELIAQCVQCATLHGTAVPVVEPVDSFRETDGERSHTVDRNALRVVQTPQVFRAELLREGYQQPYNAYFTDDASVVEQTGNAIFLCPGERTNLKITTPEDLIFAEALLAARQEEPPTDE
ncbi:MAG: 2-C-methyl-D-erythritol 4-phosphate cytidylyltransferase [Alistipes sp.]